MQLKLLSSSFLCKYRSSSLSRQSHECLAGRASSGSKPCFLPLLGSPVLDTPPCARHGAQTYRIHIQRPVILGWCLGHCFRTFSPKRLSLSHLLQVQSALLSPWLYYELPESQHAMSTTQLETTGEHIGEMAKGTTLENIFRDMFFLR